MQDQAIAPVPLLGRGTTSPRPALAWPAAAVAVVAVAVAWVLLTHTRPTYDAFGWLVWGREVLHWNLNTDGAPSWKPLTFLFTFPYALAGANPQMWLWIITSSTAALAGALLAGRLAFRLTGPVDGPASAWAPYAAAAFAAAAVLGINGYAELVLIANSDPMIMALCLGAVECHLARERRYAFGLLVLASLGRPEAWAFAGLYALWIWRKAPQQRVLALAGVALIPLAWFIVPALTSHSWFISGDLALGSPNVIHGDKLTGVISRLAGFYPLPVKVAIACALAIAVIRRERVWLALAAGAALWVAIEIAFAYHGWSAVPRYLLEPGALLIALGGAAVGRAVGYRPPATWPRAARWLPIAIAVGVVAALIPSIRSRARTAHGDIDQAKFAATQLSRLQATIARAGGPRAIEACGQPAAVLTYQSELAWVLGLNVGDVGWEPRQLIALRRPTVLFTAVGENWRVRAIDLPAADAARCAHIGRDSRAV
jgi:hypothetical protein